MKINSNPQQKLNILAVDFGTSNTYVSKSNENAVLVNAIDIEGKSNVQGTLSLLIEPENQPKMIGYTAAEELGEMDEDEFKSTKIYAQFKPDIVESHVARKATVDFLHQMLTQLNQRSLQINPLDSRVIFGAPSNSSLPFKQTLKSLGKEAGWGEIEIIDEPIGALCYHMAHQEIELQKILSSGLIIDFGGGTCDLVWIKQGNIQESWGNRYLGGRLFDDLIFQWIKDQNPMTSQLSRSDLHFIRYLKSRTVKENFSNALLLNRETIYRSTVFSRNSLKINVENLNLAEFEKRAKTYTLSHEMKAQMQAEGLKLCNELLAPCDLFDWFKKLLTLKLNDQKIDFVILAGGSSLWYFVKDLLIQEFHLKPNQIFRSARPFAAISEGLAHYPYLLNRFKENQKNLNASLPNLIQNEISTQLQAFLNDYKTIFSDLMLSLVFDQGVKSVLEQFKANGGKLNQLEKEIKDVTQSKIELVKNQLPTFTKHINEKYRILIEQEIKKWFKSHGIECMQQIELSHLKNVQQGSNQFDFFSEIFKLIEKTLYLVIGTISANLLGGSGTALLVSGPVGLLLGAAIGAVGAYYLLRYGKDKTKELAMDTNLPSWAIQPLLRESYLQKMKADLEAQIQDSLSKEFETQKQGMNQQIQAIIQAYIDQITLFQGLAK